MKKFILAAVLAAAALPAFAQQSFFIEPGTEIRSGQITRGYCLERKQALLTNENIANLTNMIGNVTVTYKDGSVAEKSFAELYGGDRPLSVTGFDSASFIRMSFDPSIEKITVGGSGLIMARKDADAAFVANNAKIIMEARSRGASSWEAQNISWESEWKPEAVMDEKRNVMTVDNRGYTGTEAGEETLTVFDSKASASFLHSNGRNNSFDTVEPALTGDGTVFITHGDNDHLPLSELERAQTEGLRGSLYVPMFLRGGSMENRRFNALTGLADSGEYDFDIQNLLCRFLSRDVKGITHISNGYIAGFLYSQYEIDNGTEYPANIEIFRHLNPADTNADGAIFRYSYKGVTWLFPGDFDDETALVGLLEASEANVKKRAEIMEEILRLEGELYAIPGYDDFDRKLAEYYRLSEENLRLIFSPDTVSPLKMRMNNFRLAALEGEINDYVRIAETLMELNARYDELPVLRAHYLKWPHHAHLFEDAELYGKIKSAVNPFYTIFQPHQTQRKNLDIFKALLKEYGLEYLDSSEHRVEMQTLEHRQPPAYRAG
jgi:hypothetical protein